MNKKTVKLTKKELDLITTTQNQKQELLKAYQANLTNINQNEAIVLQLIMEKANIVEEPTKIDIEGDSLVFDFSKPNVSPEEESKKKIRKLKAEE